MAITETSTPADERAEILTLLAEQRNALLITVRGIGDADAARRTTVSELTLGALLKHVALTEQGWVRLLAGQEGAAQLGEGREDLC
ncbi:mycothiol transferase, partial [Marinitenerispora sediminis]|uniref:mycothiol transferase n=1 Tax=Marinitenerispora sediminis TaxID=1931232 RepID=UPI001C69FA3D